MEDDLLNSGIPDEWMKLVPSPDGYDLVIRHSPESPVIRIATVHHLPDVPSNQLMNMAQVIAGAFVLLHRLDEVIDELQPDGWSGEDNAEEGYFWRRMIRTWLIAKRADIPWYLQDPPTPPPDAV